VIATFGVLMFGVSGYFALEIVWGPIWAALAIGLANCAVAFILIMLASNLKPGRELELAREVHRSAVTALMAEGRAVESEFENLRQGFRNPLDSILPGLVVPLAGILIKTLQKRSKKSHEPNV
jgi:hypothetical protein